MRGAAVLFAVTAWAMALVACGCRAVEASALPPGRHYEMVSPPYKGGYGAYLFDGTAVAGGEAVEGDRAVFTSFGVFSGALNSENIVLGNRYLSVRSATGWRTEPLMMPATRSLPLSVVAAESPSLDSVLYLGVRAGYTGIESPYTLESSEDEFLVRRLSPVTLPPEALDGPIARIDKGRLDIVSAQGVSPGLCHAAFELGFGSSEGGLEALLPEAKGTLSTLYEVSAGSHVVGCGGGAPTLRIVAVTNNVKPNGEHELIDPYCQPYLGASDGTNRFNAVSDYGMEIFFTSNTNVTQGSCDTGAVYDPLNPAVLFVRLNGERTLQVSAPIAGYCENAAPCHSAVQQRAEFAGANVTGTTVFFTTIQPLVTGDSEFTCQDRPGGLGEFGSQSNCEDGTSQIYGGTWKRFGNDLYMADLGCPGGKSVCAVAERVVTKLVQVSRSPVSGEAAEVQNAEPVALALDGDRIYFVAQGILTTRANREGNAPSRGADNLYVFDAADNSTHFITDLCSGPGRSGEALDVSCPSSLNTDSPGGRNDRTLEAQTTVNGEYLVFTSYGQLAGGDSDTARDVYRYDAVTENLTRVSIGEGGYDANGNNDCCDARIARPSLGGTPDGEYDMASRAISEDGSRIVFSTSDPLSPAAVNGVTDVYEWHSGESSLVSSGSDQEAVESPVVTPSGRDVFFMTVQSLVTQDADGAKDIYDARLGDGFPPLPVERQPCSGDACQGPLTNPAPVVVPGSVSHGSGEDAQPVRVRKHNRRAIKCRTRHALIHKRSRCVLGRRRIYAKHAGLRLDVRVKATE